MLDTCSQELESYFKKWTQLTENHQELGLQDVLPTAVGWKVADTAEYLKEYAGLHDTCDMITEVWMNERWIAKLHLRDARLPGNIEIFKLMQVRPGSTDALGLDHVDFYLADVKPLVTKLEAQSDIIWSYESNDIVDGYGWISLWFDGTEAKIKTHTVLDILRLEMDQLNRKMIAAAK